MLANIAINATIVFLFGSFILYFLSCNLIDPPTFDVPPCSSISSCIKATGLHERALWYAVPVGYAWKYSNDASKFYESARSFCTSGFDPAKLPTLLAAASSKLAEPARRAVIFADKSVHKILQGVAQIDAELYRSGVKYTPYSDLRQFHSKTSFYITDLKSEEGRTEFSQAILKYHSMNVNIRKFALSTGAQMEGLVKVSSRIGNIIWPTLPTAFPLLLVGADRLVQTKYNGMDLITASVGVGTSVFSAAVPILNEYYEMIERYDGKANALLEDSRNLKGEVYDLAMRLEAIGATDFSPELLSFLPNSIVRESIVAQTPSKLPADARIRASTLYRSIAHEIAKYRLRDNNYFLSLYVAETNYGELKRLRDDLLQYLKDYEALVSACHSVVSKYKPKSSYASNSLKAYSSILKGSPDLHICAEALRVMAIDENYATNEAFLETCERTAFCGSDPPPDYPCTTGSLEERISCCFAYLERKELDMKVSETYAHYSSLRTAVESLLSYYDDPKARSDYLALPREFVCEKDIVSATSKITKLYLQLRKDASKYVFPEFDINGYLDSKTISSIRIRFRLDAGTADLMVEYKLPFQILAYSELASNGLEMTVSKDGKTAIFKGSGWTEIEAQVMPVSLDIEEMGSDGGYVYLRILNDKAVPVRHKISGDLVSASSNVRSDGKFLYFDGVGEAVIAFRAVEANYVQDENTLYVSVTNKGEYEYDGSIIIPYSGEELPKNCTAIGDATLCSLRLKPFGRESIEIEGVTFDVNLPPLFEDFSPVPIIDPPSPEQPPSDDNVISSARERVLNLLSELEKYQKRAQELNVAGLLPFSADTVKDLQSQVENADDILALNTLYATTNDAKSSLIARAKAAVFRIPESEDVRQLAEKALVNDDYILALALAASYSPKSAKTAEFDGKQIAILLGFASLSALVYFLRGSTQKKRKKIPKI